MTPFEWLAVTYFAAAPIAAARYTSLRGWLYSAGAILLVIVAAFAAPRAARAWMPHAYLLLGYWIPAAFTPGINRSFEEWLTRTDARILRSADGRRSAHTHSRPWHLLELAYLLCYPMVPAAFSVVFLRGTSADITRFWIAVLLGGYACYVSLPWTAARPPRLLERPDGGSLAQFPEEGVIRSVNAHVLGRVSHNMNTFPSGHVAIALAAASIVCSVSPGWGVAFLGMATAIAVAAVRGRYHYLVDVLVGAGVGVAAVLTAFVLQAAADPARGYHGG